MKTISKTLILFMVLAFFAQKTDAQIPVDEDTKKVTYQEVVTQEGIPSKMYNQGIEWVNSFYKNPADATKVRDPDNAKIEIKHRIKVCNVDKDGNKTIECETVEYELSLEFKEGRYRYTFTNFNVNRTSKFPLERWLDKNDPQYTAVCDIYLKQLDEGVKEIIKSLKEGMKPKVIKDDNW